ncbi:MAG: BON domain-containing protein [Myxococcaceae bacterium]|nr:BON domain-containing protein [Myxococcaceae bacterium]
MAKADDGREAPARGAARAWLGGNWGPKSESNPGLRGLLGGSGIGRHAFTEEWLSFKRLRAERDRLALGGAQREELREGLRVGRQEAPRRQLPERPLEWPPHPLGLGEEPEDYTRPDERIREDIRERLMISPYDASDVEVLVTHGEVTLMGTVYSSAEQWGIEEVVEAVPGVREVHNELRLEAGIHPGDSEHPQH